ncbi:hypothetical protein WJX72_002265 [[Myrmecia] bisecta]|uniref:Ribosome-binding factor A n=1 Tax=[Myrmecia] bisecta TaxID=41462 RepID=A0AAW1R5T3_9CHLO
MPAAQLQALVLPAGRSFTTSKVTSSPKRSTQARRTQRVAYEELPDFSDEEEGHELDPEIRQPPDLQYRSPTEKVWPPSRYQLKFASRMRNALEVALMRPAFYDSLVKRFGFTVHEVRMAPDNLKAYILWDAFPDMEAQAGFEIRRRASKLRTEVAGVLKARHVPRLEFRHDIPSDEQAALERIMAKLDREQQREP